MATQVHSSVRVGGRTLPERPDSPPSGLALRIEGVGVQALPGGRRVDVAVDLSSCYDGGPEGTPRLELALESPTGRHVGSAALLECRESALDLVMHLHAEPEPGEYTLHVGLFRGEQLLQHERRAFCLPVAARKQPVG